MRASFLWVPLVIASIPFGCSGSSNVQCQGGERCACYPNGTCNDGLACLSDLCVAPADGTGATPGGGGEPASAGSGPTGGGTGGSGGHTGGSPGGGTGGQLVDGCNPALIDPCATLPHFAGTQVVDGDDRDLCVLPAFEFRLEDAVFAQHQFDESTDPGAIPADGSQPSVRVRLGWSETALHFHATVVDADVQPPTSTAEVWNGSGVQLFFSPFAATEALPISAGTTTAPAAPWQILVGAPGATSTYATWVGGGPLDASWFAAQTTDTGYTIEVRVPLDAGGSIAAGQTLGFNFTLSSGMVFYEMITRSWSGMLANETCADCGYPYLDPRAWCQPVAQAP